jgi:hypothetical protein
MASTGATRLPRESSASRETAGPAVPMMSSRGSTAPASQRRTRIRTNLASSPWSEGCGSETDTFNDKQSQIAERKTGDGSEGACAVDGNGQ